MFKVRTKPMSAVTKQQVRDRSGGVCEVRVPGCHGKAVQMHHKKRRSQGGAHSPDNLLHVCGRCHTWIHQHVADAKQHGWIL